MRYDKEHTRRIGGLLLDVLMLGFIVSFSFSDVKISDGYTDGELTVQACPQDHVIFRDFDSVFGSFLKHISKLTQDSDQALGVIFDFPRTTEVKIVVCSNAKYLYNSIYTNTTINAP